MTPRYSTIVRILGMALLVLAVSPVTAPFSTLDLVGLLSESTTAANPSLNTKKAPDDPVAHVDGRTTFVIIPDSVSRALPDAECAGSVPSSFEVPLRI
ncbi:MAG TPA: hypothetical protein VGD94_10180 [Vicinamibacterales bacterium]